jgi:vancomycin resistance protein YoaR
MGRDAERDADVTTDGGADRRRPDGRDADHDVRARRRSRRPLVLGAVVLLLVLAYVGGAWYLGDRVPRGTTVAGVSVGGMTAEQARERLETDLADARTAPVRVVLGDNETTIDPAEASLALDVDATVEALTGFSLDPRVVLAHVAGGDAYDPVTTADPDAVKAALERVSEAVGVAPVEGEIALTEGEAVVTEPVAGTTVDVEAAVPVVTDAWLTAPQPIALPAAEVPPVINEDAVATAMTDLAEPLTRSGVSVDVDGGLVELTPADLTAVSTIVPDGEQLVLQLDAEGLHTLVTERNPELATPGQDARIVIEGGAPVVVPSTTGLGIDAEELVEAVRAAALSPTDRTAVVPLIEVEPDLTTAEAEALGVREVVSSFSTPLFNDPVRTQNLVAGARYITNTLVLPGETFSLIDALGPITAERGFGASGVVVDGLETKGMGGGLSQISATTFNAAFLAGMEMVEWQPHSHHYARYPEGRESTVYTPHVDMKWRNTTEYGALVEAWVADGRVHVRLWGTPYYEVRTSTSDRYDYTEPTTVYNTGANCVPNSSGERGFTVRVSRTVLREGAVVSDKTWTTTYIPWDRVVCGPNPG